MYINSTSQKIKHVVEGQQSASISNGEFTTAGNTYIPNTMEAGSNYMARNKYNNVMQGEFPAGNLRIGLRGTVSNTYYWTMADNFKLYYLGSDGVVASLKEQLEDDGFNRITALPTDYSPYFYLLYDHDQDLALRGGGAAKSEREFKRRARDFLEVELKIRRGLLDPWVHVRRED